MPAMLKAPVQNPAPARATELSRLVDLEARWENLRIYQPVTPGIAYTPKELLEKQKAYETFRALLAAFNKKYVPGHVPELLLNNPLRLGKWCREMRDLFLQVEHDPSIPCPVHLLKKAYRCADRIACKIGKDLFSRSLPPDNTQAVIRELEALAQWCDTLPGRTIPK
jgi:hypothetical protein